VAVSTKRAALGPNTGPSPKTIKVLAVIVPRKSRRELHVMGCRSHCPRLLRKPFNLLLAAFAAFGYAQKVMQ